MRHKVNGTVLDGISLYDRVLIIRSDGSYTVSEAPDKLFAGRNMLYCGLVDTEQVFNLVYTDPFQYTFVKLFAIGANILNRAYQLVPERCYVEGFTADLPIRNIKANGIRLSAKESASCTILEPGGK